MHHGVRIKDAALVAAAVLSNRYITDRFLPDKAIDLVDEAAAKLRTEIDSMPTELDEILRRVMQLEIEREALQQGEGRGLARSGWRSSKRSWPICKAESDALQARWQAEKQSVQRLRALREQIEQTKIEIEQAERQYDLNRAAELKYGKLAELERTLKTETRRRTKATVSGSSRKKWTRKTSPRSSAAGRAFRSRSCSKARCRSCCTWKTNCTSA